MRNVVADFEFKNMHGTLIEGRMFFPEQNGTLYKPNKIIIDAGKFDLNYRKNSGAKSTSLREIKNEIIRINCVEKAGSITAEILKSFVLLNEPCGLVKLMSILNGYNSNMNGNLYIKNTVVSRRYKAAKLLKNLKALNFENLDSLEIVSWEEWENNHFKEMNELVKNYSE